MWLPKLWRNMDGQQVAARIIRARWVQAGRLEKKKGNTHAQVSPFRARPLAGSGQLCHFIPRGLRM